MLANVSHHESSAEADMQTRMWHLVVTVAKKHFYLYRCLQRYFETERPREGHDNHDIFPRICPLRDPLSPSTQQLNLVPSTRR